MDIQGLYSIFKECSSVTTDSRNISGGEMFVALKGENFNGNEFALKALTAGAKYAVVDAASTAAVSGDERVIPVPDTLQTLQDLARYHRENTFVGGKRLTVIGLTGTNGKTTTKELITRVLSSKYNVTATRGNLNNDIGVPLSLLSINGDTELAVIEMGANHPDDISKLVNVCEPDYGLITNVGRAHLLGFGSFEGVKKAKGQLYDYLASHGGQAFVNADDPDLMSMASARWSLIGVEGRSCGSAPLTNHGSTQLTDRVIPYGLSYLQAEVLPSSAEHPYLRMRLSDGLLIETHLAGAYNATNVAAALAVGQHFGVSLEEGIKAVGEYIPKNNRSQMEKTDRNILIQDAYNANPTSMAAALDNLGHVEAYRKAALLGDMRELGEESLSEHQKVLSQVLSMGLDFVCLVGEEFRKALAGIQRDDVFWFATSEELAEWLKANPVSGLTILVKGSRGIQMEKTLPEL